MKPVWEKLLKEQKVFLAHSFRVPLIMIGKAWSQGVESWSHCTQSQDTESDRIWCPKSFLSFFFPLFVLFYFILLVWFLWGRTLLITLGWPEMLYVDQFGLELTKSCTTMPLEFWSHPWTHHSISGQCMLLPRFRVVQPTLINLIKKLFPSHVKWLIFL